MKRIVILLCALGWCSGAWGQRIDHARFYNSPVRRASVEGVTFHNFSRTWQTIDLAGKNTLLYAPTVKGLAVTTGHSFLFHEKPLLRLIHFGFDAVWFDIEYGNWRHRIDGRSKWMHKIDMAVGAGPAIHLSPTPRFGLHAYFHYRPTVSAVTHNFAGDEDGKFELVAGYASYFSTGLALSWDFVSIGGEYRHGGGRYGGIRIPDVTITPDRIIDEIIDFEIRDALENQRHIMRGWRAYVSFRF